MPIRTGKIERWEDEEEEQFKPYIVSKIMKDSYFLESKMYLHFFHSFFFRKKSKTKSWFNVAQSRVHQYKDIIYANIPLVNGHCTS